MDTITIGAHEVQNNQSWEWRSSWMRVRPWDCHKGG